VRCAGRICACVSFLPAAFAVDRGARRGDALYRAGLILKLVCAALRRIWGLYRAAALWLSHLSQLLPRGGITAFLRTVWRVFLGSLGVGASRRPTGVACRVGWADIGHGRCGNRGY